VHESIERAIRDQVELGIDILVDGQVRDDIVSLFAPKLRGYEGKTLPYCAVDRIRPSDEPITVGDYLYARNLAGDRSLKAHITGPMTLARATLVDAESPYDSRNDPRLVRDLAEALGKEARYLVEAGAEIVQIDEPALADGVDLGLAFEAMEEIVEIGEIPFPALHICKNVTRILDDVLTRSPVKMVSIEGKWLRHEELSHINRDYLSHCEKQVGLGCIKVRDYSIDRLTSVQNFLDLMAARLGEEYIWAAMPNCGLRPVPHEVALKKLKVMVSAAGSL
jgi:5-methyltetrahydropteroyltriglutamate--homocysteine methyltransferase